MTSQQIQHGGRPPFRKSLYLHISAANCPNMTKFGMQTQILTKATKMWENFRNFQIQDGGRTPYWKSFLAITRLHIVRLRRNLEWGGIIARIQRLHDKNVKFRKSNMADGRNFENHFLAIARLHIVLLRRNLEFGGIIARTGSYDENVKFRKSNMAEYLDFRRKSPIFPTPVYI